MSDVTSSEHAPGAGRYNRFKFQVLLDDRVIAGFQKMSAFERDQNTGEERSSGKDPLRRIAPADPNFEAVTLERGLTHDPVFEEWANASINPGRGDDKARSRDFRRDVVINVMDLNGGRASTYRLRQVWVSEYQALPELDAIDSGAKGVERVVLQHEGLEQVDQIASPTS